MTALESLRFFLQEFCVDRYRVHDLRRGHAKDLQICMSISLNSISVGHSMCEYSLLRSLRVEDFSSWRVA